MNPASKQRLQDSEFGLGERGRLARRVWRPAEHSLQACVVVRFGGTPNRATETVALPETDLTGFESRRFSKVVLGLKNRGSTAMSVAVTPDDLPPTTTQDRSWDWRIAGCLGVAAVGMLLLGITACSTVQRTVIAPPLIEGADFVGNNACTDCHGSITKSFAGSVHSRFYKGDELNAGISGCESCHGAASKHIASGGGRGVFIVNPGKDPANCFQCHVEINAQFHLPNHHPVLEGQMNCVQCHDPHGRDIMKPSGALAMGRLNESCATCHREQTKPVLYEHEALREGCVTCHQPHGSVNSKLLVERDNNLCLKCHSQVQATAGEIVIGKRIHTSDIQRMSCWAAGCHTAIHGSNIQPRMLY